MNALSCRLSCRIPIENRDHTHTRSRVRRRACSLSPELTATMVSVTVSPAGKPISIARGLPSQFDLPGKEVHDVTIHDVKVAIAKKYPKVSPSFASICQPCVLTLYAFQFYPARQKITLRDSKNALNDDVKLADAGVVDGSELLVKDLGHQISWKTVFLVEYVSRRV